MTTLRIAVVALLAAAPVAAQSPSYVGQVAPFMARYCNGCHGGWVPKGDIFTGSHVALLKGGKTGPTVVPGDVEKSVLVQRLQPKAGVKPMPPADARQPLPEEIEMVRSWVANGAKDDTASAAKLASVAPTGTVKPLVAALAYSPDGKLLVAGSGSSVVFIDPAKGTPRGRIDDFDGAVTAVAFSPDGKLLAVASGRPAVLGEVAFFEVGPDGTPPAKSVRRITAHLDLVHQLAFSPDGKTLATCGYDRLVRLWDAATGARLRDLRDHSDSVYGVGFSHDGKLLATAGADRAVKIWDVATGKRLFTLGEANDWVYAIAWHPTRPTLAVGGIDRNIRVYDVTPAEGKLTQAAFAHEGAVLRLAFGPGGATLYSLGEDRVAKAWDAARLVEKRVYEKQAEALHAVAVRPDGGQVAQGRHDGVVVLLDAAAGTPQGTVPTSAVIGEENAGGTPRAGQLVGLTATINGALQPAGDVDYYRFDAKVGQEVGVQVVLPKDAKMEPVLELVDPTGRVVATSGTGLLAHRCATAGEYALGLRDREYRGEPAYTYTLKVGAVPVVTSVFPMGLPRGKEGEVTLEGANLGDAHTVRVTLEENLAPGSSKPLEVATPLGPALGNPKVVVGEFAEATKPCLLAVPGTGNGRIEKPNQADVWKFAAKKGERLVIETFARRGGSPIDTAIEVRDATGRPVPTATLRGVAKVYTTFRDNDSVTSGMRLESWNELSVNDYVLVGTELARIQVLPRNPDDDCRFFSEAGQRLGYLGTTPTHHPLGEALLKVTIHPPGATFPPNGLPVVPLFARNDDGGPPYGKDSRLFFDPPADGEYQVVVTDSRDLAGRDFTYRVTVRPPRPDFALKVAPMNPTVSKGAAVPFEITADRKDDFQGPIDVQLLGLPKGLTAPKTTILAGENSTVVALEAAADAAIDPAVPANFTVVGVAPIDGKRVEHRTPGGKPKVIDPGDIVTTTEQREVTIQPGGQTRITVVVERRNDFKGRIPIDARGLPHGVRVLDVGLNGILITPTETRRTFLLYAEPWVRPTDHPIVVTAKREGKNTDHAAPSVLLRVQGKQP